MHSCILESEEQSLAEANIQLDLILSEMLHFSSFHSSDKLKL